MSVRQGEATASGGSLISWLSRLQAPPRPGVTYHGLNWSQQWMAWHGIWVDSFIEPHHCKHTSFIIRIRSYFSVGSVHTGLQVTVLSVTDSVRHDGKGKTPIRLKVRSSRVFTTSGNLDFSTWINLRQNFDYINCRYQENQSNSKGDWF